VFFNMCMTAQNAYISYYQLNRGLWDIHLCWLFRNLASVPWHLDDCMSSLIFQQLGGPTLLPQGYDAVPLWNLSTAMDWTW
jgi:hypothetical protein